MTIESAWNRIESWLKANAKPVMKSLKPAAKPDAIDKLQTALGVTLPPDFVESLGRHNGQTDGEAGGLFPHTDEFLGQEPAWRLLPVTEIQAAWKSMKELVDIGEFCNRPSTPPKGIRTEWWHVGWVPIADNGGGDFVCLDTAPAKGGRAGQVFLFSHDSAERPLFAKSFTEYLMRLADELESGQYVYDEDEGLIEAEGTVEEDFE